MNERFFKSNLNFSWTWKTFKLSSLTFADFTVLKETEIKIKNKFQFQRAEPTTATKVSVSDEKSYPQKRIKDTFLVARCCLPITMKSCNIFQDDETSKE